MITLQRDAQGGWTVLDTGEYPGRFADRLTWEEMLGLVAAITIPQHVGSKYWLKTPSQRAAEVHRSMARREESERQRTIEATSDAMSALESERARQRLAFLEVRVRELEEEQRANI